MQPISLPPPLTDVLKNSAAYVPDDGLVAAANVALLLGQPLLITGEPGCGKTAFAYWLARELGLGEPLVDVVKSTTTGRDLLYDFDSLARFRDIQRDPNNVFDGRYVQFRPLGAAIANSTQYGIPDPILKERLDRSLSEAQSATALESDGRRRFVVLIDELDKALRDTPNDLLHEIEKMDFTITELDFKVPGDRKLRPIVVITSNSERGLPEPFLRRCVYYNIPDLDSAKGKDRLTKIVEARRKDIEASGEPALAEAMERHAKQSLDTFFTLRREFERKPGTAEFLALAIALARQELAVGRDKVDYPKMWRDAMTAIAKIRADRDVTARIPPPVPA
jgi:MoxR-like ATPase